MLSKIVETILDLLNVRGYLMFLPDEVWLKYKYKRRFGKPLDLNNPITYNQKLQWLKLNDRNPEYTKMVDKHLAKEYVADKIGKEYIIPTLGVWDRFEDIDFDSLPDQFVLKCTHDSGGLVICRNKAELDIKAAKRKIKKCFKRNYYWHGREWVYKDVKPRIIAEQYMEDTKSQELMDYKFYCFNGEAKVLLLVSDRQSAGEPTKFDFFDMDFQHLSVQRGHPNAVIPPEKPDCFEEMKVLVAKLSEGIPHVRVDFYEVDGKIYFGELTFAPGSGMSPFTPTKWDEIFGQWLVLPPKSR